MRTLNIGKALAVALLLLAPLLAHAAGLGRLSVQSGLGQPLNAEIDLVAVRGDFCTLAPYHHNISQRKVQRGGQTLKGWGNRRRRESVVLTEFGLTAQQTK